MGKKKNPKGKKTKTISVRDLQRPKGGAAEVKGGGSFQQAWPSKYSGG
jgi:hypothetical protein